MKKFQVKKSHILLIFSFVLYTFAILEPSLCESQCHSNSCIDHDVDSMQENGEKFAMNSSMHDYLNGKVSVPQAHTQCTCDIVFGFTCDGDIRENSIISSEPQKHLSGFSDMRYENEPVYITQDNLSFLFPLRNTTPISLHSAVFLI